MRLRSNGAMAWAVGGLFCVEGRATVLARESQTESKIQRAADHL